MTRKNQTDRKAVCIAVLGTGSDVGKSIVTTALCRVFSQKGLRVAPFKAQNMSNNSGVTPEGLEMGRAQIAQAEAAGIVPHVDMNPILLKPTGETGSQVVLLGKAIEDKHAAEYHRKKERLFHAAASALDRLREKYDLVIIEGAGSCAEVNLMPNDIVNFRIAEYSDAPVLLVADIHKGGVFAQVVGTLVCLPPHHQDRIRGIIINRFRGDIGLFRDGVRWIEEKTSKPVAGVLPWYTHITIDQEDSVVIEKPDQTPKGKKDQPAIAVIRLPHISNFTDFAPLSAIQGLTLRFVEQPCDLSPFTAVIIPGSKNTRTDLEWLNVIGWEKRLTDYVSDGGHILGICGGYQMMGRYVHDPEGLEGSPGTTSGLGFLSVETTLKAPKTTTLTDFLWNDIPGSGYEIHMGQTDRADGRPMLTVKARNGVTCSDLDGCIADSNSALMGTYMHGLFDNPEITNHWLETLNLAALKTTKPAGLAARDIEYNLLAGHFTKHIDMKGITDLILEQAPHLRGKL